MKRSGVCAWGWGGGGDQHRPSSDVVAELISIIAVERLNLKSLQKV